MKSGITVRGINSEDMAWLEHEARELGISVEEIVRRLIREARKQSRRRSKPSEAFQRFFGPDHGVELPTFRRYAYRLPPEGNSDPV